MKNQAKNKTDLCPCGSGKAFEFCCQPYLQQRQNPATAETLMRSRYTAFVLNNENYLRYSWSAETCPEDIGLHNKTQWLGLQIKATEQGLAHDDIGRVEFVARFKINGKAFRLHENSRFTRHEKRWVYRDGVTID
jgi:SEC-C motif-containing protein